MAGPCSRYVHKIPLMHCVPCTCMLKYTFSAIAICKCTSMHAILIYARSRRTNGMCTEKFVRVAFDGGRMDSERVKLKIDAIFKIATTYRHILWFKISTWMGKYSNLIKCRRCIKIAKVSKTGNQNRRTYSPVVFRVFSCFGVLIILHSCNTMSLYRVADWG